MRAHRRTQVPETGALLSVLRQETAEVFDRLLSNLREQVLEDADRAPDAGEGSEVPVEVECCLGFSGEASGVIVLRLAAEGRLGVGANRLFLPGGDSLSLDRAHGALEACAGLLSAVLRERAVADGIPLLVASPRGGRSVDTARNRRGSLVHKLNEEGFSLEIWLAG